ncbi:hypothetical protein SAMD00019534_122020 [Acytostelium subglobosum LB1]|uniref:hypothetical protein n=1 Tax=Acytostelium subglobosum LB1 TaxID=1410327 RepID=UPI000644F662|nr:hypothetical protein SAMD00019534_122020 [Acytostelium subglobosum LB1]GAM29026.1 hypothetical protein SAMD00019534_122020 [Acytostelium subglobosum LB1]|eukprot:XP_012748032.1 hypothetical protein SAMD00019534_122020 [Acytostelium subglobosum LB1]
MSPLYQCAVPSIANFKLNSGYSNSVPCLLSYEVLFQDYDPKNLISAVNTSSVQFNSQVSLFQNMTNSLYRLRYTISTNGTQTPQFSISDSKGTILTTLNFPAFTCYLNNVTIEAKVLSSSFNVSTMGVDVYLDIYPPLNNNQYSADVTPGSVRTFTQMPNQQYYLYFELPTSYFQLINVSLAITNPGAGLFFNLPVFKNQSSKQTLETDQSRNHSIVTH